MLASASIIALATTSLSQPPAISVDGRTNTTVRINGAVTDVRTGTVRNGSGFNSFNRLDVNQGRTVNLHVPDGASRTINLVRDKSSVIAGTLNSMTGGQIGGGIVIANPNGLVVTSTGQVNAGSFAVSTPTRQFVDQFFNADGSPKDASVRALLDGSAPQAAADVSVAGRITAGGVRLQSGRDVSISGLIDVTAREAFVSNFANTGRVQTHAGRDTTISGTVRTRKGDNGGSIGVTGGGDARISGVIDASGTGSGDGGEIIVFVDRDAYLTETGSLLAEAPSTGAGGFIELSGKQLVSAVGHMSARTAEGAKGQILIDPETFEFVGSMTAEGQDITIIATQAIIVQDGATISTRVPGTNLFYAEGDAGDITLQAPTISIGRNVTLDASGGANASCGFCGIPYMGGIITLEAIAQETLTTAGIAAGAQTRIEIRDGSVLKGREVNIIARSTATVDVETIRDAPGFFDNGAPSSIAEAINNAAAVAVDKLQAATDITLLPAIVRAEAVIDSSASLITATGGTVTVDALAETLVSLAPEQDKVALAGVGTFTDARVVLRGSTNQFGNATSQNIQSSQISVPDENGVWQPLENGISVSARTKEVVDIDVTGGENGSLAGLALGFAYRDQSAIVEFRSGSSSSFTAPVTFGGRTTILADAEKDISIKARAADGKAASVAGAVDLAKGETIVAGGFSLNGEEFENSVKATTRVTDYTVQAVSKNGTDTTGGEDIDSGAVRDEVDGATGNVTRAFATGEDEVASGTPAPATSEGTAGEAFFSAGLALSRVTQATEATTASTNSMDNTRIGDVAPSNGAWINLGTYDGQAGSFELSAETAFDSVAVTSEAVSEQGVIVSGAIASWDLGTTARLERTRVEASADDQNVLVSARTQLPMVGAADPLRTEDILSGLSATDTGRVAARAAGNGQLGFAVAGAYSNVDTDTTARVTSLNYLRGQEDWESNYYGGGELDESSAEPPARTFLGQSEDPTSSPEFLSAGRLTIEAMTNGRLDTRANDPVWSSDTKDGNENLAAVGAGVAIGVFDTTTHAALDKLISDTFSYGPAVRLTGLDISATNALYTTTAAGSGQLGSSGAIGFSGALAYSKLTTDTRAALASEIDLVVKPREDGTFGATTVSARDDSKAATVAGVAPAGSAFSLGLSAALTEQNRKTRAGLGELFELDYIPYETDQGGYYEDKPALFDRYAYDTVPYTQFFDLLTITADTTGGVATLASAGTEGTGAEADADKPKPARIGALGLSDDATSEDTLDAEDEDNPGEGAKGGFAASGAAAVNYGTVNTQTYIGTLGKVVSDDTIFRATDSATTVAQAGGIVSGAGLVGIGGGFARDTLTRNTEAYLRGLSLFAFGDVDVTVSRSGETTVQASGASGRNGAAESGVPLAGSYAVKKGSDDVRLEIGSASLGALGPLSLSATNSATTTIKAGADAGSVGNEAAFGVGLAAAQDLGTSDTDLIITRYSSRDLDGTYIPPLTYSALIFGEPGSGGDVPVLVENARTTTVEAASSGQVEGFALSGSAAIAKGARSATLDISNRSGDVMGLIVPGGIDAKARVVGSTTVKAGSDASGKIAVGVSYAAQKETLRATTSLGALYVSGLDETYALANAQDVTFGAVTDADQSAIAIAGAAVQADEDATETDATETPAEGAEASNTEGSEEDSGTAGFAGNGAMAVNKADVQTTLVHTGTGTVNAHHVTLYARESSDLSAQGGGKTEAGDAIGAGLGIGRLKPTTTVTTDFTGLSFSLTGAFFAEAMTDTQGSATATNGALSDKLGIGVNIAGGEVSATTNLIYGDETRAGTVFAARATLLNQDLSDFTASADAVNATDETANSIAVGVSGFRGTRTADLTLTGTEIYSGTEATIQSKTAATFDALSEGVRGTRVDFAKVNDSTDDEGNVTSSGGFNLEIAAALANLNSDATVTLDNVTVDAGTTADLIAEATLESAIAGLGYASADLQIADSDITGASIEVSSIATSTVAVDGSVETNHAARTRAEAENNKDLLDKVTALAESDSEDDKLAFSAAFTPQSAKASATTNAADSSFESSDGDVDVRSVAKTDVTLGAGAAPFAVTLAMTETNALTKLSETAVIADEAAEVTAKVVEAQDLTATANSDSNLPVDAAAIISIRKSSSRLEIANALAGPAITGDTVLLDALTERDLSFNLRAHGAATDVVALGAVVSYSDALTQALIDGTITATDTLAVGARTRTSMTSLALATGGDAVEPATAEDDASGSGDGLGGTVRDIAGRVAGIGAPDSEETTAEDGTEKTIDDAVQIGAVASVFVHTDAARTVIGTATLTAGTTADLYAKHYYPTLSLNSGALLDADVEDTKTAVAVAVTYAGLAHQTELDLTENATVTGDITARAETRYRGPEDFATVDASLSLANKITGFDENAAKPELDGLSDSDFAISQTVAAFGDKVGVGVDVGVLNLDAENTLTVSGTLTQTGEDDMMLLAQTVNTFGVRTGDLGGTRGLGELDALKKQSEGETASVGGAVSIALIDEVNRVTLEQTASLSGGDVAARAVSDANYANFAKSTGSATKTGVNGALALTIARRDQLMTVDPRVIFGAIGLEETSLDARAIDQAQIATMGDTFTSAGKAGVGVGVGLTLLRGKTSTVFGTRDENDDAIAVITGAISEDVRNDIHLGADTQSQIVTLATPGVKAGADFKGMAESLDFDQIAGGGMGEAAQLASFEKVLAIKEGIPESDYGIGITGGFAMVQGTATTEVIADRADLSGFDAASFVAQDTLMSLTHASAEVEGLLADAIAGAGSVDALANRVTASLTYANTSGRALSDLTVSALSDGMRKLGARGGSGPSLGDYSVVGSGAVMVGAETAIADLSNAQLDVQGGSAGQGLSLTAKAARDHGLYAGVGQATTGKAIGVSASVDVANKTAEARLDDATIDTRDLDVLAEAEANRRLVTRAGAISGTTAVQVSGSVLTGRVDATVSLDNANLTVASAQTADIIARTSGDTAVQPISANLSVDLGIMPSVNTLVSRRNARVTGTNSVMTIAMSDAAPARIAAQRTGDTLADGVAVGMSQGTQIGAAAVTLFDRGDTRVDLTGGQMDVDGGITIQAVDSETRNVSVGAGNLTPGVTVNAVAGYLDDKADVTAILTDMDLTRGTFDVTAQKSGDSRVVGLIGAVTGGGSVSVNGAVMFDRGNVTAHVLGAQTTGGVSDLSVTAKDAGDEGNRVLSATLITGDVGSSWGVGVTGTWQSQTGQVSAVYADSETRAATPLDGTDLTIAAETDTALRTVNVDVGAQMVASVSGLFRMQRSTRDVVASLSAGGDFGHVTVDAQRADNLTGVSAGLNFGGTFGGDLKYQQFVSQGGTLALADFATGSVIDGNLAVTALDASQITGVSAGLVGSQSVAASVDVMLALRGNGSVDEDDVSEVPFSVEDRMANAEADAYASAADLQYNTEGAVSTDRPNDTPDPIAVPVAIPNTITAQVAFADGKSARVNGGIDIAATDAGRIVMQSTQAALSGGVAVLGPSAAFALDRTETSAGLLLPGDAGLLAGADINVTSDIQQGMFANTIGLSVASNSFGLSFGMTFDKRASSALIGGGTLASGHNITVDATSSGQTVAMMLMGQVSASAGFGAGVAVSSAKRETSAKVDDVTLIADGENIADLSVKATSEDAATAYAQSLSVSGTAGASGSIAVAISRAGAEALVTDATLALDTLAIEANSLSPEDGSNTTTAAALPVALSGGSAGVAGGLAIATRTGSTKALLTKSVVTAQGDVLIGAASSGRLQSIGVGVAGGGSLGVAGSVSVSVRKDETIALAQGGSIDAQGNVAVAAYSTTDNDLKSGGDEKGSNFELSGTGVTVGFGGATGIGASVSVPVVTGKTEAALRGLSRVRANGSGTPMALSHFYGGQSVTGLSVLAESELSFNQLTLTAGVGGTVGVGALVDVVVTSDEIIAEIVGAEAAPTEVITAQDVTVEALGDLNVSTITGSFGGGGGAAGVGASVQTLVTDRTIEAQIKDAQVDLGSGDLRIAALSDEQIITVSFSGGASTIAGVGAGVLVHRAATDVSAKLIDTAVSTAGDITVDADLIRDRASTITSVGIAGKFGGAGALMILSADDNVVAAIENTGTPEAITAYDINVTAQALKTVSSIATTASGAIVGGNLTIATLIDSSRVLAEVSDGVTLGTQDAIRDLTVTAQTLRPARGDDENTLTVGGISGSFAAVGATFGVVHYADDTLARIGAAQIDMTGDLSVTAFSDRDLDLRSNSFAVGLGGALGFIVADASYGFVAEEEQVRGRDEADAQLAALQGETVAEVEDGDDVRHDLTSGTARADDGTALAQAGYEVAVQDVRDQITATSETGRTDRTRALVDDNAQISTLGGLDITATDVSDLFVRAGTYNVSGGVAFAPGLARGRVATEVAATIGAATVAARNVTLTARSGTDQDAAEAGAEAGAGSLGLTFNAAPVVVTVANDRATLAQMDAQAELSTDGLIGAPGTLSLTASAVTPTSAIGSGFAGSLGGAASGIFATAKDTSTVKSAMAADLDEAYDVDVASDLAGELRAEAKGFSMGLVGAGSLIRARTVDSSLIDSTLAGTFNGVGDLRVTAESNRDVVSLAEGVNGGALAIGLTFADADVTRSTRANFAGYVLNGGRIDVLAKDGAAADRSRVFATAKAGSGGALTGAGADSDALLEGDVSATFAGSVYSDDMVTVRTVSGALVETQSDAVSIGGINGGAATSESGLTRKAQTVVSLDGVVSGLSLAADSHDEAMSRAQGSGGAIAGVLATGSEVAVNSLTDVVLKSSGDTGRLEVMGALNVTRDASLSFGSLADTVQVTALGVGRAKSLTDITRGGGITIGSATNGYTLSNIGGLYLSSRSDISKDRRGAARDAEAGTGSLVDFSGAIAEETIRNRNAITFASGALVQNFGYGNVPVVVATSSTDTGLKSRMMSGGAVVAAKAEAVSTVTQTATVTVAQGAAIHAYDDIQIATRSDADIDAQSDASAFGLGSRLRSLAEVDYNANAGITVAGTIESQQGDIFLSAGQAEGRASDVDLTSNATFFAGTIIPLDKRPESNIIATINHGIDVTATGEVLAGRTLNLTTAQPDLTFTARGRGKNTYTATAEEIANFAIDVWNALVSDENEIAEVDLDIDPETEQRLTLDTGVKVDGRIASGRAASINVTMAPDGTFLNSDGTTTTTPQNARYLNMTLGDAVALLIEDLDADREAAIAAGDTALADLLALQAGELAGQLQALAEDVDDTVKLLQLNDLIVPEGKGDIRIAGDFLVGTGTVSAGADVGVTVDVQADDVALFVGDITLPITAGQLFLDGVSVTNTSDVAGRNASLAILRAGEAAQAGFNGTFAMAHAAAEAQTLTLATPRSARASVEVTNLQDIFLMGDIDNRNGTVEITSVFGDYYQLGSITADEQVLSAVNGDVLVGYQPGVNNIKGQPDLRREAALLAVERSYFDGDSVALPALNPDSVDDRPALTGNSVSIFAETINLNGEISAGSEARGVVIGESADLFIQNAFGGVTSGRYLVHNPDAPDAKSGITGDIGVYWNATLQRFELQPVQSNGGRVLLAARDIISTGGGAINTLDGFTEITVDSRSVRPLYVDTLDTGGENGVRGVIEFVDFGTVVDPSATEIFDRYRVDRYEGVQINSTTRGLQRTVNGGTPTIFAPQIGERETFYAVQWENGNVPYLTWDVTTTFDVTSGSRLADYNSRIISDYDVTYALNSQQGHIWTKGDITTEITQQGTFETQTTTHFLRATEDIAIGLFGSEDVDLNLRHKGEIQLAGDVVNAAGDLIIATGNVTSNGITRLSETGLPTWKTALNPTRRIVAVSPSARVVGKDIMLTSHDGVAGYTMETGIGGTGGSALTVKSTDGGTFYAGAFGTQVGDVDIAAPDSRLNVRAVIGDNISLSATGSILGAVGGLYDALGDLTLTSLTGSVDASGSKVRGDLNIYATGDINFSGGDPFGALELGRIESQLGNISITSTSDVVDANTLETRDVVTEASLLQALWTEAGYLGAEATARQDAALEAEHARRRTAFEFFWTATNLLDGPYDPTLVFDISSTQAQAIADAGGDPNSERRRLTNLYHEGFAQTGGQATDPTTLTVGAGLGVALGERAPTTFDNSVARNEYLAAYDPNFVPTISAQDEAAIRAPFAFTAADLDLGLSTGLVRRVTDTQTDIEVANISAPGNVYLEARNIGQDVQIGSLRIYNDPAIVTRREDDTFYLGPIAANADGVIEQAIDRDFLVMLAGAEPEDVEVANFTSHPDGLVMAINVYGTEDVDIDAGGEITAIATEATSGRAFIGSELGLNIEQANADARVRLKTAQALVGRQSFNDDQTRTAELILEAGNGGIGSEAAPFRVAGIGDGFNSDQGDVTVTLRAAGDIFVSRGTPTANITDRDLIVRSGFTTGHVSLTNTFGSVLADPLGTEALAAGSLSLTASADIGGVNGALDPLRVSLLDDTRTSSFVAGGSVNVRTLALGAEDGVAQPSSGTLRVGSVQAQSIRLATEGDLLLQGESTEFFDQGGNSLGNLLTYPAIVALGQGNIVLQTDGSILDVSDDRPVDTPINDRVADIEGGDLRLLVAGAVGTADNPIETDMLSLSGGATDGAVIRDKRDLVYAGISTPNGVQDIQAGGTLLLNRIFNANGALFEEQHTGEFGIDPDFTVAQSTNISGTDVRLAGYNVQVLSDVTFSGNALKLDASDRIVFFDGADLIGQGAGGRLSLEATRLKALGNSTIDARGLLDIAASGSVHLDQISGGQVDVFASFVTQIENPNRPSDTITQVNIVDTEIARVTSRGNLDLVVTGNSVIGPVKAAGDANLDLRHPYQTGLTTDLASAQAGGILRVTADDLASGLLPLNATQIQGNIGGRDVVVSLSQPAVRMENFIFRGGGASAVQALGTDLTLGDTAWLNVGRVDARTVTVAGAARTGQVFGASHWRILDGMTILKGSELQATGDLTVDIGQRLLPDYPNGNAKADLIMAEDAKLGASGSLTLNVADRAEITGLSAGRVTPGLGLSLTAGTLADAGNVQTDITANNPGVITRIQGNVEMKPTAYFTTQINTLEAMIGTGDLNIYEQDTLIVTSVEAGRGKIDILAEGDMLVRRTNANTKIEAYDDAGNRGTVILTAGDDLFSEGVVNVRAGLLALTSLDGNIGSIVQPFVLGAGVVDRMSATAAGSIVMETAIAPGEATLFAADQGALIVTATGQGFAINQGVSVLGTDLDNVEILEDVTGVRYTTRPEARSIILENRYSVRQAPDGGIEGDIEELRDTFEDFVPPRFTWAEMEAEGMTPRQTTNGFAKRLPDAENGEDEEDEEQSEREEASDDPFALSRGPRGGFVTVSPLFATDAGGVTAN
ncbi:leukotoxin LktA family filamentous adhesin [Pseudooceanicola sp. MF1-13]|uniref:leukotoxin LktA family filamentous adhesin n=1 Tax=Pseudooceanicola sp. MF1-13 TaxID=3379095 RepID=UPI003891403B